VPQSGKNRKISGVQLRPEEELLVVGRPALAAVWWKFLVTLGFYTIWRRRDVSVLTDQRVILGKGVFSRREQSIPMRRIDEAVYVRRGMRAYCEVASHSGEWRHHVARVGPLRWGAARKFTREIDART
jgi:hypothetical protein